MDPVPLHVAQAEEASRSRATGRLASARVGDARRLDFADGMRRRRASPRPALPPDRARRPPRRARRGPPRPEARWPRLRRRHLALRLAPRRPPGTGLRPRRLRPHRGARPGGRPAPERDRGRRLLHHRLLPPARRARGRGAGVGARPRRPLRRGGAGRASCPTSGGGGRTPGPASACSISCGGSSASRPSSARARTSWRWGGGDAHPPSGSSAFSSSCRRGSAGRSTCRWSSRTCCGRSARRSPTTRPACSSSPGGPPRCHGAIPTSSRGCCRWASTSRPPTTPCSDRARASSATSSTPGKC